MECLKIRVIFCSSYLTLHYSHYTDNSHKKIAKGEDNVCILSLQAYTVKFEVKLSRRNIVNRIFYTLLTGFPDENFNSISIPHFVHKVSVLLICIHLIQSRNCKIINAFTLILITAPKLNIFVLILARNASREILQKYLKDELVLSWPCTNSTSTSTMYYTVQHFVFAGKLFMADCLFMQNYFFICSIFQKSTWMTLQNIKTALQIL